MHRKTPDERQHRKPRCSAIDVRTVVLAISLTILMSARIATAAQTIVQTDAGPRMLYSESYALLIAEANYDHWPKLKRVTSESVNLSSALEELGFEKKNILVVPDVKSSDLLGLIQMFVSDPAHRKNDVRLFIYYSGHGDTKDGNSFLVPVDAPVSESPDYFGKAILMSTVKAIIETSTARHTLVVFDSCFSGGIFGHKGEAVLNALQFNQLVKPAIQIISAGDETQRTPAQSEFLNAFVAGARGGADYLQDGFITTTELIVYLKKNVKRTTPEDGFAGLDTSGSFVFIPPERITKPIPIDSNSLARAQVAVVSVPEASRPAAALSGAGPAAPRIGKQSSTPGATSCVGELRVAAPTLSASDIAKMREQQVQLQAADVETSLDHVQAALAACQSEVYRAAADTNWRGWSDASVTVKLMEGDIRNLNTSVNTLDDGWTRNRTGMFMNRKPISNRIEDIKSRLGKVNADNAKWNGDLDHLLKSHSQ